MIEHRTEPRRRQVKGAKILLNRGHSTVDCILHNLSTDGACLKLANGTWIPDEFDLSVLKDNQVRPCKVIWRKLDRVGVIFI